MNPIDSNAAGPASGGQPLQQESYAGESHPKRRGWAAQPLDSSGCPPGAERAEWIEADGLGGFASGTRTVPWNREQLSVPDKIDNPEMIGARETVRTRIAA